MVCWRFRQRRWTAASGVASSSFSGSSLRSTRQAPGLVLCWRRGWRLAHGVPESGTYQLPVRWPGQAARQPSLQGGRARQTDVRDREPSVRRPTGSGSRSQQLRRAGLWQLRRVQTGNGEEASKYGNEVRRHWQTTAWPSRRWYEIHGCRAPRPPIDWHLSKLRAFNCTSHFVRN